MIEQITEVFVEQHLALPGSVKKLEICFAYCEHTFMIKPVLFAWEIVTWLNRLLGQLKVYSSISGELRLCEYPEPM